MFVVFLAIGNASEERSHYHSNENTIYMVKVIITPTRPLNQTCFLSLISPPPMLGESVTATTNPSLLFVAVRFVSQTQLVSSIAEEHAARCSNLPIVAASLSPYHS